MSKSISQHIIEKSNLCDAGREFVIIAMRDMNSYGFGTCWHSIGQAAYNMVKAIRAVEPDCQLGNIDELNRWCKCHGFDEV